MCNVFASVQKTVESTEAIIAESYSLSADTSHALLHKTRSSRWSDCQSPPVIMMMLVMIDIMLLRLILILTIFWKTFVSWYSKLKRCHPRVSPVVLTKNNILVMISFNICQTSDECIPSVLLVISWKRSAFTCFQIPCVLKWLNRRRFAKMRINKMNASTIGVAVITKKTQIQTQNDRVSKWLSCRFATTSFWICSWDECASATWLASVGIC